MLSFYRKNDAGAERRRRMERLLILEDDLALGEGVRLALQGMTGR